MALEDLLQITVVGPMIGSCSLKNYCRVPYRKIANTANGLLELPPESIENIGKMLSVVLHYLQCWEA